MYSSPSGVSVCVCGLPHEMLLLLSFCCFRTRCWFFKNREGLRLEWYRKAYPVPNTEYWQHWCLSRYTAAQRRISQTRASQRLRPVAVSARLAPSHASYRSPELVWATGRLMSPDRGFGTSCLLHCGRLTVSVNLEDSWKRFCLSRTMAVVPSDSCF